jgi:CCR4-NOT transcription complex subunit 1
VLAKELKKINPQIHPNFAFAWVEIISNKFFMPALLERYEYWDLYFELFCCLFKFMREYLTEDNLNHPEFGKIYQYFYKGVLKLTTMIIHDFPDFLSEFSLYLTLIPGEHFLQLSNMINSTYPNEMKFDIPQKVEKR